jgi:acetyl-CoA acetyltransferase
MTEAPMIIGVGMTAFGKYLDGSVRSLATMATREALADAGVDPSDVDIAFFSNAVGGILHGQEMIRGQSALRSTGLLGTSIFNVENACASGSSAFALATMAVSSGTADVAIAVGAEKLTHPDKSRSILSIATAVDLEEDELTRRAINHNLLGWDIGGSDSRGEVPPVTSRFMDIYAAATREYMARSGATAEDLAAIAAKNHSNGALNPLAQYRQTVTVDQVMASRIVSDPLRLLMCSPIGDGAAAIVVCSPEYARRHDESAVRIAAVAMLSGRGNSHDAEGVVEKTAKVAYERAGIGPEDVDLVELHDAASTGELVGYEDLGLCPVGDGPKLLASGATQPGGRVPVNLSGGLLSRGHPIGATGCAQIYELVTQLRGRAEARQAAEPQVGLAQNAGGHLGDEAAAAVVTILTRP